MLESRFPNRSGFLLLDTDDKRPVAVVLCGPPGSGKTTFRRKHLPSLWGVVSSDHIIMDLASENKTTYSKAFHLYINHANSLFLDALATYLMFGRNLILDRTHLTVGARKSTLDKIGKSYRIVAVYFPALPLETLLERIDARERVNGQGVPADAVRSMLEAYTVPTLDEGFDAVINAEDLMS